jgi:hypothetical protein
MRSAIISASLFLSLTVSTHAQALNVNGANLFLGQSEVRARAEIKAAGMGMNNLGTEGGSYILTIKRGEIYESFGSVTFEKGKVTFISRDWYLDQPSIDKNALANIFYSAATSLLEGKERATCTISVRTKDFSPSQGVVKTTEIECIRSNRIHTLSLMGSDCSAGCSIGDVTGSVIESVKEAD